MTLELLQRKLPHATPESGFEPTLNIPIAKWAATVATLRNDPDLSFDLMSNLTGVDRLPETLRLTVNLISTTKKHRVCLHVDLPRGNAEIESLVPIYAGANFYEREVFDLFGVRFLGHPNLKRLLMPDDYAGHPLLKDFTHPDLVRKPER